jgi:hypothetical protein
MIQGFEQVHLATKPKVSITPQSRLFLSSTLVLIPHSIRAKKEAVKHRRTRLSLRKNPLYTAGCTINAGYRNSPIDTIYFNTGSPSPVPPKGSKSLVIVSWHTCLSYPVCVWAVLRESRLGDSTVGVKGSWFAFSPTRRSDQICRVIRSICR